MLWSTQSAPAQAACWPGNLRKWGLAGRSGSLGHPPESCICTCPLFLCFLCFLHSEVKTLLIYMCSIITHGPKRKNKGLRSKIWGYDLKWIFLFLCHRLELRIRERHTPGKGSAASALVLSVLLATENCCWVHRHTSSEVSLSYREFWANQGYTVRSCLK